MKRLEKIIEEYKSKELKHDKGYGYEKYMIKVATAEKAERISLNLQGDKAIKHWNKWMKAAGLEHLMIKK